MLKGFSFSRLSQHWLVLVALFIAISFTVVQAFRMARHLIQPYQRDEEIHGWMTLGYIGHSYRVSPQLLQQALGLPELPPDKRPLVRIAKAQGRSLEDLSESLQAAITQAREALPEVEDTP